MVDIAESWERQVEDMYPIIPMAHALAIRKRNCACFSDMLNSSVFNRIIRRACGRLFSLPTRLEALLFFAECVYTLDGLDHC